MPVPPVRVSTFLTVAFGEIAEGQHIGAGAEIDARWSPGGQGDGVGGGAAINGFDVADGGGDTQKVKVNLSLPAPRSIDALDARRRE